MTRLWDNLQQARAHPQPTGKSNNKVCVLKKADLTTKKE